MTEAEMWAIFEKCDGDPVMISQFVDWIMENDCSDDLKSLTNTLLWMRDNEKWPQKVNDNDKDLNRFWGSILGARLSFPHRLPDDAFKLLPPDAHGFTAIEELQTTAPVLIWKNLFGAIQALDHALRRLKNPKVGVKPEKVLK